MKLGKLLHLHIYRAMQKDVKNGEKVKAESSNFKKQKEKDNLGKTGHLPKLKGIICSKI